MIDLSPLTSHGQDWQQVLYSQTKQPTLGIMLSQQGILLGASARSLLANNQSFVKLICNKFSTATKVLSPKLYELRVYNCYPKDVKTTVKRFEDFIHFRTKHSKLFGFWSAEIGGTIFQFVHLWEYDSLSQRAQVRKGLLQDTVWQEDFMQYLLPSLQSMSNALLVPTKGTQINTDFKNDPAAVYDFQSVEPGAKDPKSGGKSEILVGRFTAIFDSPKKEYRLWRYTDIDAALAGSVSRSETLKENGTSILLVPAKFSPIL